MLVADIEPNHFRRAMNILARKVYENERNLLTALIFSTAKVSE